MTTSSTTELLHGSAYLECPRWHDGALWVSDFYRYSVLRATEDGDETTVLEVPGQPGGLGWWADGSLVIASMRDRRILRRDPGGAVSVLADLSELTPWPLNDLAVDTADNVYVGDFGFDVMSYAPLRTGSVFCVRPDGSARRVADEMWFANGMAVTPTGDLLVAETFAQRVTRFRTGEDGSLHDRAPWFGFGPAPSARDLPEILGGLSVAPDGFCLDRQGGAWVADCIGQRAVRVLPEVGIVDEVSTAGSGVFACALGGADGRTLFLCCAPSFDEADRSTTRESFVRAVPVTVPG